DILEIGSYYGFSTACLALANRSFGKETKVSALDPHYFGSLEVFQKNMQHLGLADEIESLALTSDEAAASGWKPRPLRVLWIDGHHEYEFVVQDVCLWEPYLQKGGVILFHDAKKPGVQKAVKELMERCAYHSAGDFNGILYAIKGKPRDKEHGFVKTLQTFDRLRSGLIRTASRVGLGVKRSGDMVLKDKLQKLQQKPGEHSDWMKTLRQILSMIAVTFLGIFLVCGFFEIGLRLFTPEDLAFLMKGRQYKLWAETHSIAQNVQTPYGIMKRLKPNISQHVDYPYVASYDVLTGSEGYRTLTFDPQKKKVMVVGDSLTFGYWVDYEKSWPALVDREVQKEFPDYQVVNAGIPGLSTIDEFILLKDLVPKYKPEYVLVGFSVGNDYYDNYKDRELLKALEIQSFSDAESIKRKTSLLQRIFDAQFDFPFREKLKVRSYLLSFIWMRLTPTGVAQNYWTFTYPHNAKFLKGVEITQAVLVRLNEYLKSYGCQLMVVILPTKEQIDYERYEQDYAKRNGLASLVGYHFPPRDQLPYYTDLMDRILNEQAIPHINLYPEFIRDKGKSLFFERDFHPSEEGYKLIAEKTASFLKGTFKADLKKP
ncbi:MAG: hypothetical protein EXS63_09630, partial [Candidatus Omnitrophica bacterium]|nr:hypothetical protein [Candidatus Omnitrophota bacterium]